MISIKASNCPPHPSPITCFRLGHTPAPPPCLFSLSLNRPCPSALWSSSLHLTFWFPPQCPKTVTHNLPPEYMSLPVPPFSHLLVNFTNKQTKTSSTLPEGIFWVNYHHDMKNNTVATYKVSTIRTMILFKDDNDLKLAI